MQAPTITIEGKKYKANKPKVKLWRQIVEFNKNFGQVEDFNSNIDSYDAMLELLANCFNVPEVTTESIENHVDLDQLLPMFQDVTTWVGGLLSESSAGLPGKN